MLPITTSSRCRRLLACSIVLGLFAVLPPNSAQGDDQPLDAATLKKVKAATVHFQVKLQDGRVGQATVSSPTSRT